MKIKNIILADDHKIVIGGIKRLLNHEREFEVVASVGTSEQVLEYISDHHDVDLLISDINMPGSNNLDYLNDVFKICPDLKVIVFSMHEEKEYVLKALSLNVKGYLDKNVDDDVLIKGIRTVLDGGSCYSGNILNVITSTITQKEEVKTITKALSDREREVLKLIVDGHTSAEIGEKLFISNKTVAVHRYNLMKKLNVKNMASLIKLVIEKNII